jgi:diguanylate cyclase (GGDEF)-like protein/PAS domain S-box-containing protein
LPSNPSGRWTILDRVTSVFPAVPATPNAPDRESLLASALDAIVSIDADGRVVEFNPSAERTFGYARCDAIGRTLAELIIPPADRGAHRAGVRRVAGGGPFKILGKRLEVSAMRCDGSEFPAELTITQTSCDPFMVTAFVRDLTERHQADRALRESEERFAHAFVQAPVGIVLFHLDAERAGQILQVNEALCAMTLYPEGDVVGRPIQDLTHPDDLVESAALFREVLGGTRARLEAEHRFVRADGSTMCALVHASAARSDTGEPIYGIAQLLDITERKAAEHALRESEAQLAETQRLARIGTWGLDVSSDRFDWSEEVGAVFGLEADDLVDRARFLELVHPADRERIDGAIARILTGTPEASWQYRVPREDGSVLHVYAWGDAVFEDGQPVRLQGYLQDVTERRLAEERAADLRRENDLILNAAGDGIYRTDVEGRATYVNPAAAEMLGYEPGELDGTLIHELVHHTHPDGTPHRQRDCPAGQTARDGRPRRRPDDIFWRKDGTPIRIDFTSTPIEVDGRPAGAVVVFSDVTERREMEGRLRRLADFDSLTGLVNRRRFEQLLEEELAEAGGAGALLLVDLDHFKFVNDSFGHAAGDDLIRAVATVLAGETREGDELARVGGDEFALLLRRADHAEAAGVSRRLLAAIEGARPRGLSISASIGATTFDPDDRATAGDLLVAADIALYEAKDAGRGRTSFFAGTAGTSLTWVERIRTALEQERFVVHAQPIVDLASGRTVHEELLVRMIDERGDVVPPSSFLPTAEKFGLIGDIDRWMLRQGVDLAASGRPVHINLSGQSLGRTELLDDFERWMTASGANPADIVIELTETLAVANMAQAGAFAKRLQALGCGLALDDFGTGFGSFTYLKHLPADFLKIDMEFVRDIAHDETNVRVVDAIVDVARRFGLRTIAEGVEDERTLDLLREAGVDCAQGYHLGRPVDAHESRPGAVGESVRV